jgi:hypothetical protein
MLKLHGSELRLTCHVLHTADTLQPAIWHARSTAKAGTDIWVRTLTLSPQAISHVRHGHQLAVHLKPEWGVAVWVASGGW